MPSTASVAARLSGPGELAAALPLLCGFVPHESLVLVCLEGARRIGLTLRLDLPPEEVEPEAVAAELAARVRRAGATAAYLVLVSEEPGFPRRRLVDTLVAEVDVVDAVLVRGGRWWSYLCGEPRCCPSEGTPVPATSPTLRQVQAEAVLLGRAVLPSRADLVASLAPPPLPVLRVRALEQAAERLHAERRQLGLGPQRSRLLAGLRGALDLPPGDAPATELALALDDVVVRDEVLTWTLSQQDAVLALLHALARQTPAPYDAAVCASLAWVAYGAGDGATAAVAVERALDTDPGHGLALLLDQALDAQVSPRELRAAAARARVVLRRRRRR